jgi:hypothetical protein
LRRLVAEVGGSRVRWLAGLNQEWRFLAAEAPLAGGGAWRLGTIAQRRDYLTVLRARDPAAARELVADGWERAGVSERVMFLWVLADHLELPDEPLLEAALDDRADEVRRQAADLLARLPGSALGQRMAERALRHLRIEHDPGGRGGPRLVIVPMAESDAAMRRDGITPAPDPRSPGTAGRSQFAFSRLSEIIARTPLPTWTQAFGLAAAQIITLPAGDWMPMLLASWLRAAIAQDDQEWMTALVNRAVILPPRGSVVIDLLRRLARHADPRLGAPGTLPVPDPDAPPIVRDMMTVLRFRYEMLKELGHEYGDG